MPTGQAVNAEMKKVLSTTQLNSATFFITAILAATPMIPVLSQAQDARQSPVEYRKTTLAHSYIAWKPNGIIVGKYGQNRDKLIIVSVITNSVRVVGPDAGKVVKQWAGEENGMLGADDMTEGPDGTIYHVNADEAGIGYIKPNAEKGFLAKEETKDRWASVVAVSVEGRTLNAGIDHYV